MSTVATAFDRDTAVEEIAPGVYSASMGADWFIPVGPNGGYVAAIVLRAIEAAVADPARAPRSLTCHYLRPPAQGDVQIAVTVERAGRSVTALSARLTQGDDLCVLALAAFAKEFASALDYSEPPPEVPAIETTEPRTVHPEAPPMARMLDFRPVLGERPFSGADHAVLGGWTRLAEPRPVDAAVAALMTDAWLPAPWTRLQGLAPAPTIDLTIHFRARLPLDESGWVLGRFASTTSRDGFFEEDGELWAQDGTLIAQSRQLALLRPEIRP